MPLQTRSLLLSLTVLPLLFASPALAQKIPGPPTTDPQNPPTKIRLHNGWMITPVGRHEMVGDVPEMSALSPDGKTLAVTTGGSSAQALHLIDSATGKIQRFKLRELDLLEPHASGKNEALPVRRVRGAVVTNDENVLASC